MKKIYLLALIMSIITGLTVFYFVRSITEETPEEVPTVSVVVAKQNISGNTVLTQDMLEVRQIPAEALVSGWAQNPGDVVGKMTPYPLLAGENIFISKLVELGEGSDHGLSLQLSEGYRAITVDVNNEGGVGGYIKEGDYVDLIAILDPATKAVKPEIVLKKVKVIKVGNSRESNEEGGVKTYTSITLSVTPEQAKAVAYYDNASVLIAVLRPLLEE